MFPEFSERIAEWLESVGLNPIYIATLFVLILLVFDIERIQHWEELNSRNKRWIVITAAAAILLVIGSIVTFIKGPQL